MSHAIVFSDERYEALKNAAARSDETPDEVLGRMVNALAGSQGTINFTDDELLRALGADDEEIAELAKLESH